MKTLIIFFLTAAILNSSPASALEFSRLGGTLNMDGEITEGDAALFLVELASWETAPALINIDSPGGNLDEAMHIGTFIRDSQITVSTWNECNSACIFILAAGVDRIVHGTIGLHRPHFEKSYFADLDSREAEARYKDLIQESTSYLISMGVSQSIVDRMFATSSKNIDVLSPEQGMKLLGGKSPFYEEWLSARCESLDPDIERIANSINAMETARIMLIVIADGQKPTTDQFRNDILELLDQAIPAYRLEKSGSLIPMKKIIDNHSNCVKRAENEHIVGFHRALKQWVHDLTNQ